MHINSSSQPLPPRPTGQRVRAIALQVESLDGGRLRLSTPHARGWAAVVATPHQFARAVQEAFVEVSCASYALARGAAYDLDSMTTHVAGDPLAASQQRRVRTGRTTRIKSHPPEAWTKFENGKWRSPAGRVYRPDTKAVQNVIKRRTEKGLPT